MRCYLCCFSREGLRHGNRAHWRWQGTSVRGRLQWMRVCEAPLRECVLDPTAHILDPVRRPEDDEGGE